VQKIVIEIKTEIGKPCSIMQKIVTEIVIKIVNEIGMEQTQLFPRDQFCYADFRD